jgi:hypothetical protein
MNILEVTGLTEKQLMCYKKPKVKTKKKKRIKDESYGLTGGASNPPLSAHLTPTKYSIYGSWI